MSYFLAYDNSSALIICLDSGELKHVGGPAGGGEEVEGGGGLRHQGGHLRHAGYANMANRTQ